MDRLNSNDEDEETDDDNKRHHTAITKHWKKKIRNEAFYTSHNKNQ